MTPNLKQITLIFELITPKLYLLFKMQTFHSDFLWLPPCVNCCAFWRRGLSRCDCQTRTPLLTFISIGKHRRLVLILSSYCFKGTKETAFIYAIMAAGLVHAVTRACSAGNMTECSCDTSLPGTGSPAEGWQWGGCSDDIAFGTWFSRRFIDNSVKNTSIRGEDAMLAMNHHNSEAGRQVREMTFDLPKSRLFSKKKLKEWWSVTFLVVSLPFG